jgi:DNA polymerase-1
MDFNPSTTLTVEDRVSGKRLIIIDSNSVIHRAYHALPPLTTKKGELVNAVYGFLLLFLKVIREFQPDFIAAAFDFPGPTFRHKKFKEYKAKRPPAPEELYQQIPKVKEILESFDVPVFEKEGFEADDIIGTISHLAPKKQVLPEIEIIILSGDLDTLQLVNLMTKVYSLRKGVKDIILYDEKLVREKFQGLGPKQLLDFKALRGDPSDNIPGVTGIGEKTAIELLLKFENLENIYKEIEENSEKAKKIKPKLKETLLKYKEQAFVSKDLANLCKNVPIDFNLKKCRWGEYNKVEVIQILKKLEFHTLIKKIAGFQKEEKEKFTGGNLKLW